MKPIERRLAALEGVPGINLSHLTDDELRARIVALLEGLEREGLVLPDGWREADDLGPVLDAVRSHAASLRA